MNFHSNGSRVCLISECGAVAESRPGVSSEKCLKNLMLRQVTGSIFSGKPFDVHLRRRYRRSGRRWLFDSELWNVVRPIRRIQLDRTPLLPSCKTRWIGVGANLKQNNLNDQSIRRQSNELLSFCLIAPNARAISSIEAVPLEGSMEPKLHASRWFPTRT